MCDVRSVHAGEQFVDQLLAVSPIPTLWLIEPVTLVHIATTWSTELEGPEEIGDLLEMRTGCVELMDHVFNAADSVFAKLLHDDFIRRKRDPAPVHLAVAALVDKLPDGLQAGVTIGDVGLNALQQICDWRVHLEENAVVNLPQPQKLQNLPRLRSQLVDTGNASHKEQLRLRLHEEVAKFLCLTAQGNELLLSRLVLLVVAQSPDLQLLAPQTSLRCLLRNCDFLVVRELRIPLHLLLLVLRYCNPLWESLLRNQVPLCHFCEP